MLKRAIMLAFHLVQHENEIKKLQWKDFDFQKKEVRFIRQKTNEDIVINFSQNHALNMFLDHIRSTRKELSPYVICYASKKGWQPYSSFKTLWHKALKNAGYEKGQFKFKEIRHLSNTCMKDAGITADKRKAMTGHSSIATNEIYTHKTATDTMDASRALGRYCPENF